MPPGEQATNQARAGAASYGGLRTMITDLHTLHSVWSVPHVHHVPQLQPNFPLKTPDWDHSLPLQEASLRRIESMKSDIARCKEARVAAATRQSVDFLRWDKHASREKHHELALAKELPSSLKPSPLCPSRPPRLGAVKRMRRPSSPRCRQKKTPH